MKRLASLVGILPVLLLLLLPTVAFAQAQIAGVVKDTSGSVLPGVTVEAASPVLIEKTRSVVTDGTGQYNIVDLRPGTYTVTYALPGFNTVKREGVELTGGFVASINIEMKVGAVEETVTVTGETPIVDVQSTTTQRTLSLDLINSMPAGRNFDQIAQFVPGVAASGGGARNIGNVLGGQSGDGLEFHGTVNSDSRVTVAGLSVMTLQAGGGLGRSHPDLATAQEVTIDTGAVNADLPVGGVRMNFIPRDGGNTWHLSAINSYSNSSLQASNFTQRLQVLPYDNGGGTVGLTAAPTLNYNWDLDGGFGGPVVKDKVWFWFAGRKALLSDAATISNNKNAYDPTQWVYVPDPTQQGVNKGRYQTFQVRTTWQATPRDKIALTYKYDGYCQCPSGVNATTSPEAGTDNRNPRLRQYHGEWTSPVTSRILLEAVAMNLFERWGSMNLQPRGSLDDPALLAIQPQMISVTDQANGLTYRNAASVNNTLVPNWAMRQALTYVTGAHTVKVGLNETWGYIKTTAFTPSALPVAFRVTNALSNPVANQITERAFPLSTGTDENLDFGAFVQDRWTLDRLTLNGALRFDYLHTSAPEQTIGPSPLTPGRNITFPYADILKWKDYSFRTGVAYDVQGDGKTAVKVTFNRYLNGQTLNGIGSALSPANLLVTQTNRTWTDTNGNFVPDCDLTSNLAQSPGTTGSIDTCAATAQGNFGSPIPGTQYNPNLLNGWGVRPYNYEWTASVQREIVPRVSVDVGYFRRVFGNFQVTDNLSVGPSDFDSFSMVTPTSDPRLPGGGGVLPGLLDLKVASFGRPQLNYVTLSDDYGKQIQHWNGVDVNLKARLPNGVTIQGGVSSGKTVVDNCEVAAQLPESLLGTANSNPTSFPVTTNAAWSPAGFCHQESPFLTQVKVQGVYTFPRYDVQVSANYADAPGPLIQANYVATNTYLLANSTLGRTLSSGAAANNSITVNMLAPGEMYGDRLHNLDLSVGKIFRVGVNRFNVRADLYNTLNKDTVVSVNNSFSVWQRPIDLVPGRFAKLTVNWDF